MRIFGYIVAALMVFGGVLYFGGYISGDADVEVTPQGRQAVKGGLETTRQGINDGLKSLEESVVETGPTSK